MKRYALILLLCLFSIAAPGLVSVASTPTPTPSMTLTPSQTFTPSPTLNNTQIIAAATLAPPGVCGTIYMPCGPLPWNVPFMPTLALASPTLYSTLPSPTAIPITATPSPTLTFTASPTPGAGTFTLTPTPGWNISSIQTEIAAQQNQISTLSALGTQSSLVIVVSGTPSNLANSATQITGLMGPFFAAIKGVAGATTNSRTYSVVSFIILLFAFVVFVVVATLLFPVLLTLIRFILSVITALKP